MLDDTEFYRERRLPPYVFAEVNRLKFQARSQGADIVDLGMGIPIWRHPIMLSINWPRPLETREFIAIVCHGEFRACGRPLSTIILVGLVLNCVRRRKRSLPWDQRRD